MNYIAMVLDGKNHCMTAINTYGLNCSGRGLYGPADQLQLGAKNNPVIDTRLT